MSHEKSRYFYQLGAFVGIAPTIFFQGIKKVLYLALILYKNLTFYIKYSKM
nr:MAG TPA: hypothetical protein [Caudoviricetes sp.]